MKTPYKQCQYCGYRSDTYMDRNRGGWYCRTERACFNRLLIVLRRLREGSLRMSRAGSAASNICFNLNQYEGYILSKVWCESMKAASRDWDAVKAEQKREIA